MVVNITTSFESRNTCLRATHRQAQNTQKRILFGIGLPAISSFLLFSTFVERGSFNEIYPVFSGPFHVAWYPLWEFSKTGRKDREREGTNHHTRPQDPADPASDPVGSRRIPSKISFPIYSKSHIFHTLSGIFKPHEILQTLSEILHVIQYAVPVPFNLLNIYRTLSGIFGEYFRAIDVNQPNWIASYSFNGAIHTFV